MTRSILGLPAVAGGPPVRDRFLPFAAPDISQAAIDEVVDTLRSGWLATGKKTERFEQRFAGFVGNAHAVGTTSGTSALLLALEAAGVGAGDEVITTPLTFVATANAVLHRGATPVFADIDETTLNLDPERVEARITPRTKAILPVHYAGRPCDMGRLDEVARRHGLTLVSDSAHAIEAIHRGRRLATWSAINAFSFHPIKNLTTGEGGMVTTEREDWAATLRRLRLHGQTSNAFSRHGGRTPATYDVLEAGYKCNMSDLQASIGLHQLDELDRKLDRREQLWESYDRAFASIEGLVGPAPVPPGDRHARHLYTVLLDTRSCRADRAEFCRALRAENIGTGHHYPALHRTTYYRKRFGLVDDDCPHATDVADQIVSLPLMPSMTDDDAGTVIEAVRKVVEQYR